jgi:hypothetical protein
VAAQRLPKPPLYTRVGRRRADVRPGPRPLLEYQRRRAFELAGWTRSLAWRVPLVAGAGLAVQILAAQAGLPRAGPLGLVVAALVLMAVAVPSLRTGPHMAARRPRGRHTARMLDRLISDGYVVFHDLAVPGSPANTGRWWISD